MPEVSAPLKEKITEALRTCYDPEIPVNIYDLGLIYDLFITDDNEVKIAMTLTSPNCPSVEELPREVEEKVKSVPGVSGVDLQLVWEPPFSVDMMSDEARLSLGLL